MRENRFFSLFLLLLPVFICLFLAFTGCEQEKEWTPGTSIPKEEIKIAFIHLSDINKNSRYDDAHYKGSLEMQNRIGLADRQIIRKVNVFHGDSGVVEGIIRDCIAEGANIIISTSYSFADVCEKLAEVFPSVIFIQAMGNIYNNKNLTFYTIRLYQAFYLSGVAAGLKTKTNRIGYVAAMGKDNSEVTSGVSAFAIGVEKANPDASVYVSITHNWYDPMGEADKANALISAGCDVIAAHCDSSMAQTAAERAGVWAVGFNSDMSAELPDTVITSVVQEWGSIYTELVESIITGTFRAVPRFLGIADGAVDITMLNERLAEQGMEEILETERRRIITGGFNIFDGYLETNDGRTLGETGKTLPDEVILFNFNWYYRNITSW